MTRETKIGLLVGLAFVLMFGILISDHLSSTNEPLGAPLRVAGDTLRSGLGQPGNDDVAPVLRAPQNIAPQQPVVTNEELNHPAVPPVRFVAPATSGQAITPAVTIGNGTDRLRQVAQQQGEEIVPAGNGSAVVSNSPAVDPPTVESPETPAASPAKSEVRTYEAQPGDSLGAIALKAYGSSCRANRELIVKANPSLAANRDLIVAGRTYTIPALSGSDAPTPQPRSESPAATSTLTYVVKPHDTLWSIAMSEVGSPSAVAAIEELNRDVLNGSDRVRPNMRLTLPGKKTAE